MRLRPVFVGLLSLIAVSCSIGEIDRIDEAGSVVPESEEVFYVTIGDQPDADTKVYADEDLRIKWNADDRLSVFNKKTYNREFRFNGGSGTTSGAISPVGSDGTGEALPKIYAVYPYAASTSINTSGTITYTLPSEQSYYENSFGVGANAMVSVTDDNKLRFKNAGGYLSFKFYGDGVSVSSITLQGNNGEHLSGSCTISTSGDAPVLTMSEGSGELVTLVCDPAVALGSTTSDAVQFMFVLPPVTLTKGFKVMITTSDGKVFEQSSNKERTIARSSILRLQPLEVVPHTPYYASTDYSKDGEVVLLQEATVGRGVNIIFLGDGFVDTDMVDGGRYDRKMEEAMEQFFAYEPYTTFRNRFNVYAVRVVSENAEYTHDSNRRLTYYKDASTMGMRAALCTEYASRIPNPYNLPLKIGIIANTEERVYRSVCAFRTDGACWGFVFDRVGEVLNHEVGGHGFANLFDEYVEKDETFTDTGTIDSNYDAYGWGANVDWRSDPSTVRWSRFLGDGRYSDEGLGLYEGAYLYGSGIYRPTENSMMRYNDAPFNAPSREQIYKTIMRYSEGPDWQYDYDAFVVADAAGRAQAAGAFSGKAAHSSVLRAPSRSEQPLPPVLIDRDVKDVIVDGKGRSTVVR